MSDTNAEQVKRENVRRAREAREAKLAAQNMARLDRTALRATRSPDQQTAVLNARLGADLGARRERARLARQAAPMA